MTNRCLALVGALVGVIVVVSLVPVGVAGQARTAPVPRTPWGEPDLQGIWSVAEQIPLERPEEYAGRALLTDEEVAELDRQKALDPGRNARAEPGSQQDVGGAYNAVFNSILRTGKRTSLIVDPPDGRRPPLTAEAQKRREMAQAARGAGRNLSAADPEDRSASVRCLGLSLPAFGGGSFASGTVTRLVQSPGYVAIYYEHNHAGGANRIIPVDGSPHLPSHLRPWLGDARGHWEGDTLVVDTTNFQSQGGGGGRRGASYDENLHLVERYTRIDANTLEREITIDDPTVYTRPWTVLIELGKMDDTQNLIFESACHEGNFAMTGMLAGARAQEQAAAAK